MKKLLRGFLILIQILILFGCEEETKDTRLIFKITLDGSAVSGCRVDVYGSSADQSAKTNVIAQATSGTDGKVTFTDCSPSVYYVDFVINDVIFYSDQTNTLTSDKDNVYNVTLYSMTLTLNNDTYTPIKITVHGSIQKTIAVGSSLTYTLPDATSVYIVAETYEVFNDGVTQLGQKISWNCSVSTPNTTNSINLGVASTVCYFKVQNNGSHILGPLYFNYGNAYQYYVNANIPTGGGTYNLGYYQAVSGGEMRAYWYPSTTSYSYWIAGSNFTYPNTNNQLVTLINNSKGFSVEGSNISVQAIVGNPKILKIYKPIKINREVSSNAQLIEGKILE